MTDIYLPGSCGTCGRAFLTAVPAGTGPTCSRCGGPARVVPGEMYRAIDAVLFDQVETAVHSVAVPLKTMLQLVAEVSDFLTRTQDPESLLLRVLESFPLLGFLKPAIRGERERLVRGLGMLLAICAVRVEHLTGSEMAAARHALLVGHHAHMGRTR